MTKTEIILPAGCSSPSGPAGSSRNGTTFVASRTACSGLDRQIGDVEFPPLVAVGGGPRLGVVVVVPAFAVAR